MNKPLDIADVGSWVNPIYARAFDDGALHEQFCARSPFKHAVLEEFFLPEALDKIKAHVAQVPLEESDDYGIAKSVRWFWGPFADPETLGFMLAGGFRPFIDALMDETLVMRPSSIPQFNTFQAPTKGLPIHNDKTEEIDVVCLLQMTDRTQPSTIDGGEFLFHERTDSGFKDLRVVPPAENTLILFKVGDASWHSVADMKGDWERKNISFDFFLQDPENKN